MKRTIVVIALFPFLLLLAASCHKITYEGNTGKIVYTHYDPAININLDENQPNSGWDTIFLDFDRDGSNDMMIYFAFPYDYPAYAHALGTWQLCGDSDDTPVNELNECPCHMFANKYLHCRGISTCNSGFLHAIDGKIAPISCVNAVLILC